MMYPNGSRVRFCQSTGTVLASAQRTNRRGHHYAPTFCWVDWDDPQSEPGGDTIDENMLEPEEEHLAPAVVEVLKLVETAAPRAYDSLGEALSAPGMVYAHWKGGIYRLLSYIPAGARMPDMLPIVNGGEAPVGVDLVIYEHLWPHAHQYYVRSATEFFDHEARQPQVALTREHRRFTPYEFGEIQPSRLIGERDRVEIMGRCGLEEKSR